MSWPIAWADSSGGGFIQDYSKRQEEDLIDVFITLSTPWNGHEGAQSAEGPVPASTVIPAWYDMVPDSKFQRSLFKNPLPDNLKYYLMFSYRKGEPSLLDLLGPPTIARIKILTGENEDGAITLKSQLAAKDYDRMYPFDEDHISILKSPEVFSTLNSVLETSFEQTITRKPCVSENATRRDGNGAPESSCETN